MKLDLRNYPAGQDMIRIVMRDKGMSAEDAVDFAINRSNHDKIVYKGWASIALGLWGHDDYERKWETLDEPVLEIELDDLKTRLIEDISEREEVDIETAVCYFLIFTMEALGYHV